MDRGWWLLLLLLLLYLLLFLLHHVVTGGAGQGSHGEGQGTGIRRVRGVLLCGVALGDWDGGRGADWLPWIRRPHEGLVEGGLPVRKVSISFRRFKIRMQERKFGKPSQLQKRILWPPLSRVHVPRCRCSRSEISHVDIHGWGFPRDRVHVSRRGGGRWLRHVLEREWRPGLHDRTAHPWIHICRRRVSPKAA